MKLLTGIAVALIGLAATPSLAQEHVATPSNPDGWSPANVRTDATVGITGTHKPAGESGSLQFTTNTVTPGQDKADFTHSLSGTLGDLAFNTGANISFQEFKSHLSTTRNDLAAALRLGWSNPNGQAGYLIYEPTYNGYPSALGGFPGDSFVPLDITNAFFWMKPFGQAAVEQYNVTLDQWANGATFNGSPVLNANTQIFGIEIGVGSGWGNSYNGAVDHVNVNFGRAGTSGVSTNFELNAPVAAVPEPGTWAMMMLGFGIVGFGLRSRRKGTVTTRIAYA